MNKYSFSYQQYAKDCLTYYCSNRNPRWHNAVERKNWCAVRDIMGDFNDQERQTIINIYSAELFERDAIIKREAKKWNATVGDIYALMAEAVRRVGRKRGLI